MNVLSFDQFLTESLKLEFSFFDEKGKEVVPKDFRKVQFLSNNYDIRTSYGFKFIACHSLFKLIDENNLQDLDPKVPTVNFGLISAVQKLIDAKKIDPKVLYNKPVDKAISSEKEVFHKTFAKEKFLPKTVFTATDAEKLKFPIIAKPSVGHSGIGITKFDSVKELRAYDSLEDFALFSEAIPIDKEVRLVYLKNDLISFMIREPRDEKSKVLQGKSKGKSKASDKLDFVYHICLPEEIGSEPDFYFAKTPRMKELESIRDTIRSKVPLEYLTLDIAIDTEGKMWVIEINTEPGSSGVMLANLYVSIFRDFYKRDLDAEAQKYLAEIEKRLIAFTLQNEEAKYVLSTKFIERYIK
jgi:hypothetical protein